MMSFWLLALLVAQGASFPRGQLIENVQASGNPDHSYTLYVPSNYDPSRQWPVLICLDARQRGNLPVRIFQEAAEEYGYIILSSNNSFSDGPPEPTWEAMMVLSEEASRHFNVHPNRFYLAGFSGTARMAFLMGQRAPHQVAGVLASSGGLPRPHEPPPEELLFDYFLSSGTTDFNYFELLFLDHFYRERNQPVKLVIFEGDHRWAPKAVATTGLAWMEIRAMQRGVREVNQQLAEQLYQRELESIGQLEERGEKGIALTRYDELLRDFQGLIDLAKAKSRKEELQKDKEASRQLAETREALIEALDYYDHGSSIISRFRLETIELEDLTNSLRIRKLKKQASGSKEEKAQHAQILLSWLRSQFGFYLSREFLEAEDYLKARVALQLVLEIDSENPRDWFNLARAEAGLGNLEKALAFLERAAAEGPISKEWLEGSREFAPLRKEPRFIAVVEMDAKNPL